MLVTADVEGDSLTPSVLWCIGVLEHETGRYHLFRRPDLNPKPFLEFAQNVTGWVFHNGLWYDVPAINTILKADVIDPQTVIDTLVVSRLLNFNRPGGHSAAQFGEEFGFPKIDFHDFSKLTPEMEAYLEQDVRLGHRIFEHFQPYIFSERWREALRTEHDTAWFCRRMHENGFAFDKKKCDKLLGEINTELSELDSAIQKAFPPRSKLIREITPSLTKTGVFHKKDFKWYDGHDYTRFTPGAPFSLIEFNEFNPGSPAQVVERLNEAGWKPYEKTKSHIQAEREALRRDKSPAERDRDAEKLERFRKTGWRVSEGNLETLPASAPQAAKSLARRILLASRKGDLEEWLGAYRPDDGRIHGNCNSIGAWTQRASHNNPNTANIAAGQSLYAHEMRSLWVAGVNQLLIGVDADGIQLRLFAHYCRDDKLVEAILRGNKADKTDIHSVNQRGFGDVCKSRDDSKTGIYALLLGSGIPKLASIFGCTVPQAKQAMKNILEFYPGWSDLKKVQVKSDFERGYFEGLDGRLVLVPEQEHKVLAGYLQNGEAVVMKRAKRIWIPEFEKRKFDYRLVNWVHDEWITETSERIEIAAEMGRIQAEAIAEVGEMYKLYCPLAGSYLNPNTGGPMVGNSWYDVH